MKKMRTETKGRLIPMRNLILRTLAVSGMIGVALVAPKTLTLLKKLDRAAANRKDLYRRITQSITKLQHSGLVQTSGERGRRKIVLTEKGHGMLQDSVWIHPYQCDEFVGLVRAHLKSGTGEMLSFTAEALESDKKLREHFHLL